jgi:hypothetical protein
MEWMEEGPAGPAQCRDKLPFYTKTKLKKRLDITNKWPFICLKK